MTDASVHIEKSDDDVVRMVVSGEIDLANAADVEKQIFDAIGNELTACTLDLSGVEYIDSAGLRVLFTLATRLETLQIALELIVPTESPIRRVIDVSGVTAAVGVRP